MRYRFMDGSKEVEYLNLGDDVRKVMSLISYMDDTFPENQGFHVSTGLVAGISDAFRRGYERCKVLHDIK